VVLTTGPSLHKFYTTIGGDIAKLCFWQIYCTGKIQRVAQERRQILHITPSQSHSEVGGADCDLALAWSLATDMSCCMRLCGLRAWDFVTWGQGIVTD